MVKKEFNLKRAIAGRECRQRKRDKERRRMEEIERLGMRRYIRDRY